MDLLYSLSEDLEKWRKKIFVEQEAEDIHYLDENMLALCGQIKMILSDKNETEEKDFDLF